MTDSSSLANALSEPLRQPFWWAALASISLHGVFGANAPTISKIIYGGGNSSKNIPGSVGLVELTAAEAGRLPQTIPLRPSNKPFAIAPVPLRPSPKLAAPLPPAPPTINLPALPPGMPPPGFFSPLPEPPLPPSPAPTAPPPPKPSSPTPKLASPNPRPFNPPPNSSEPLPTLPNFGSSSPPPPPPSQPLTEPPLSPLGGDDYDPATLQRIIDRRGIEGLSPIAIATPQYPRGETNSGVDRSLNLPGKSLQLKNPMIATGPGIGPSQPFDPKKRNPEPGQPDPKLRGDLRAEVLDSERKYIDLFNEFKGAYADLATTAPTPVNVDYPTAACSQKLEGKAVFGVFVDPQGAIRATPRILMETGYGILDYAAKTAIPQQTFSPASTHKLYKLTFEFKYDQKICGGAPLSPRTDPIEQQPAPTRSPSPAPAPAPAPTRSPSPAPAPAPAPTRSPSPAPAPVPAPTRSPSPAPAPVPAPSASPEPAPAPAPAPSASPEPAPAPAPVPAPSASPEPAPAPVATPSASPEPGPAPVATPSASPEPGPAPVATPSASPEPGPAATEN